MVYQAPHVRMQRISDHSERVSAQFRKALAIVSFYPANVRDPLLEQVSSEYSKFYTAVELALSGRYVREIQEAIGSEARSWLMGQVPEAIARYSFSQVSDIDLAKRNALAEKQIAVCRQKRDTALEVLGLLRDYDGRDRALEIKAVQRAFRTFNYAFDLYRRGVSWREIANLTGEPMQSRIEDKTIPEIIVKFAGYPLSPQNQAVRDSRCAALRASAQAIFERAKTRQSAINPQGLESKINAWRRELKSFHLAVNLYQRGLDASSIKTLTTLSAHDWLKGNTLPVKVTRAGLDHARRDFTIPKHFDRDFSYVAGAIFASKRIYSREQPIVFRAAALNKLMELKEVFERAFKTTLPTPRREQTKTATPLLTLVAARRHLVSGILDRLGIDERSTDLIPPSSLIRERENRVGFIKGFLEYSSLSLDIDRCRFELKRDGKLHVIKALGVAMYLEGIYPLVTEDGSTVLLTVRAEEDFHRLVRVAPGLLPRGTEIAFHELDRSSMQSIGTYENYRMIQRVLDIYYGHGEKLDFRDILRRAGIPVAESEQIPKRVKHRIYSWHKGTKPTVAHRAEILQRIFAELYGASPHIS